MGALWAAIFPVVADDGSLSGDGAAVVEKEQRWEELLWWYRKVCCVKGVPLLRFMDVECIENEGSALWNNANDVLASPNGTGNVICDDTGTP